MKLISRARWIIPVIFLSVSLLTHSQFLRVNPSRMSLENFIGLLDYPLLINRNNAHRIPAEATMSTPQLIRYHGYRCEEHNVVTEDGYILTVFRIPHGKNKNSNNKKGPVILQHGLQASSDNWLLANPSSILPYLLVEDGHDVWLGNCRGNHYSKGHANLTTDDLAYWNFSFHEMGIYDIPALTNYVLETTRREALSFVCHSMGTTMFFIAMSRLPHLQDKVTQMVALAPVAYIKHLKSPFRFVAYPTSRGYAKDLLDFLRNGRAVPDRLSQLIKLLGPAFCSGELANQLCKMYFILAVGFNPKQTTNFAAAVVPGHTPSDASMKTIRHFAQFVVTDRFQEYDFGRENNLKNYGVPQPPIYNLTNIKVPILAIYANNDKLVVPQDALRTISELGNVVESSLVADTSFSHFDFTYARDVKQLVYVEIVRFLSR